MSRPLEGVRSSRFGHHRIKPVREKPELRIEGKTRKVGFLNPETKLINIDEQIPVYVSALGPRARRTTADVDAHWINVNFTEEFSAITARRMETEYRAVGRDPAGKRKTIFSFGFSATAARKVRSGFSAGAFRRHQGRTVLPLDPLARDAVSFCRSALR